MSDPGSVGVVVRDEQNRCRIRVFSGGSSAVTIIIGADTITAGTANLSAYEARAVRRALTKAIRRAEANGGDDG